MTRPKDEMGSKIVSSESDISHPILVHLSRNSNSQPQARRFPALTAPEPEVPGIFGSKWDPLTSVWRQGGDSPEKLAELPTVVSPLQKRIWEWDFYHCSSCNFFFHICFCHLWCELPAGPPEAILVIFGRRALIFFCLKALEKNEKWHHFCVHAQWWSAWRRKNVEKGHLAPSNLTFLLIAIDTNGFRRMKEEG